MHDRIRQQIRSLAPRVTQAEAIAAFQRGVWRALSANPLRSVAAAYVPFRLYEVEIVNGGKRSVSFFAADAVIGSLDLYEFDHLPAGEELVTVESSNSPIPQLDEERSLQLLEDKVQRAVFQAGFFRVRGLAVRARRLPIDVHVPYWLGFFGSGERVHVRVMDAVRRQMEGAKARALFEDWLIGTPAHPPAIAAVPDATSFPGQPRG